MKYWATERKRDEEERAREALKSSPSWVAKPSPEYRGTGCPRCGSAHLTQKRRTTTAGWGLFAVAAFFILMQFLLAYIVGGGLNETLFFVAVLVCMFAAFLTERRAECKSCHWRWRV